MIEFTKAYVVGDRVFAVLQQAQEAALMECLYGDSDNSQKAAVQPVIEQVVLKATEVVDILTMTPTSHPRARKANGATRKPRKAKSSELNDGENTSQPEPSAGVTVTGSGKYRGK